MTTEGRREGFVGWMRARCLTERHVSHCSMMRDADDLHDTPVYVQPLVEGEPVPGETWIDGDRDRVTIHTTPYDDDGIRRVVVRYGDMVYSENVSDLTRAPETREHYLTLRRPHDGDGSDRYEYAKIALPADMSLKDAVAAIRTAVEVERP